VTIHAMAEPKFKNMTLRDYFISRSILHHVVDQNNPIVTKDVDVFFVYQTWGNFFEIFEKPRNFEKMGVFV